MPTAGQQAIYGRVVRVLALRAPEHKEVWCRKGSKSRLLRLPCHRFLAHEPYPPDAFEHALRAVQNVIQTDSGDGEGKITPLGWLGDYREVVEADRMTHKPKRCTFLTFVVSVKDPRVSRTSKRSKTSTVSWFLNQPSVGSVSHNWQWEHLSTWVRQIWEGEVVDNAQHWVPRQWPTEGKFNDFLESHGVSFEGFGGDDAYSKDGLGQSFRSLHQDVCEGRCNLFVDSEAVELDRGNSDGQKPRGTRNGLVIEQHVCRVRIWHPQGSFQLFEIGPEDVAHLIVEMPSCPFQALEPSSAVFEDLSLERKIRWMQYPLEVATGLLQDHVGLPDYAIEIKRFRPPIRELSLSKDYPGILMRNVIHEVHAGLLGTTADIKRWITPPRLERILRDTRRKIMQAHSELLCAGRASLRQRSEEGAEVIFLPPFVAEIAAHSNSLSAPSKWGKIRHRWSHHGSHQDCVCSACLQPRTIFMWMSEREAACYNPPHGSTQMENRLDLAQAIANSHDNCEERQKLWISSSLMDGAMYGHMNIIQKCLAAAKKNKLEPEVQHDMLDRSIAAAAKQYSCDTVRLLVHYDLERLRKFIMSNNQSLNLTERVKLVTPKLRQLLRMTVFAGDDVSVRQLLQMGIDLSVSLGSIKLSSSEHRLIQVNRTLVEKQNDLSFISSRRTDHQHLQTLRAFLWQLVSSEKHESSSFSNVVDFIMNCQLPLHQCCACAQVLLQMCKHGSSLDERRDFQRFADMFVLIVVRALDECPSTEKSRWLLEQQDSAPEGLANTTVSELAIKGRLTRIVEHPRFQELEVLKLFGMPWCHAAWTAFDSIPGAGLLWRIALTLLLCLYLLLQPCVYLLGRHRPKAAAIHRDAWAMLESSYFKMLSSSISYIIFVLALFLRSSLAAPTSDIDSIDGSALDIASLDLSTLALDLLLFCWSLAFALQYLLPAVSAQRDLLSDADGALDLLHFFAFLLWMPVRIYSVLNAEARSAAEQLLGMAAMLSVFKFFILFKLHARLGPLYFCMRALIGDVIQVFTVCCLSTLGFWIAFQFSIDALGRYQSWDGSSSSDAGAQKLQPFGLVLWTFFGEFALSEDYTVLGQAALNDVSDFSVSELGKRLLTLLFFCCLLIHSVVLVNLLIAMMNNTYHSRMLEAGAQRNTEIFFSLIKYNAYSAVPPPFNLVLVVASAVAHLVALISMCGMMILEFARDSKKKRENGTPQNGNEVFSTWMGPHKITMPNGVLPTPNAPTAAFMVEHEDRPTPKVSPGERTRRNSVHRIADLAISHLPNLHGFMEASPISPSKLSSAGTPLSASNADRHRHDQEDESAYNNYLVLKDQQQARNYVCGVCKQLRESDVCHERVLQARNARILEHRLGFNEVREKLRFPALPSWATQPGLHWEWESLRDLQETLKRNQSKNEFQSLPVADLWRDHSLGNARLILLPSASSGASACVEPQLILAKRSLQLIIQDDSQSLFLTEVYESRGDHDISVQDQLPAVQLPFFASGDETAAPSRNELRSLVHETVRSKLGNVDGCPIRLLHMVCDEKCPQVSVHDSSYEVLKVKHICFTAECVVEGLPKHDFFTTELESGGIELSHHWKWRTETQLIDMLSSKHHLSGGSGGASEQVLQKAVKIHGTTAHKIGKILKLAGDASFDIPRNLEEVERSVREMQSKTRCLMRSVSARRPAV